jgi:hypothetical protein
MASTKKVLPVDGARARKKATAKRPARSASSNNGKHAAQRSGSKLSVRAKDLASTLAAVPEDVLPLNDEIEVEVEAGQDARDDRAGP